MSLLSTQEAAEYLGLSSSVLYQWRSRGMPAKSYDLPYYNFGGKILYKKEDLDNFIEKSLHEPVNKKTSNG